MTETWTSRDMETKQAMIDIAICDAAPAVTSVMENIFLEIAAEQKLPIECSVFFDSAALIQSIRQGALYDLICLEIKMQDRNDLDVAKLLRDMELPALLVYITGCSGCWKQLINMEPFRFLTDPTDRVALRSVFLDAFRRLQRRTEYFSYQYNKSFHKLPLNEISYFESRRRTVIIHTKDPESGDLFYEKLDHVEKRLAESNQRFLRIHQSFLVNFSYMKQSNATEVTLTDGTVLPISEHRQKNVRRQIQVWTGEGGKC